MLNIDEADLSVNPNSDRETASGSRDKEHSAANGSRQGHDVKVSPVFRENAEAAIICGWSPIPGRWKPGKNKDGSARPPKDAKRPLHDDWQQFCDRQMTATELAETYRKSPYAQLHLAMGFNDVIGVDRDTDCPLINRICDDILGRSNIARRGNKGRLDIFRVVGDPIPSQKFLGKNESDPKKPGVPIIEFIGHGGNVRMYPSLHPENSAGYISLTPDTIFDTTFEEVPTITVEQVERLRAALAGFMYAKPERPASEQTARIKVKKADCTETDRKRYQAMADKQAEKWMKDLAGQKSPGRSHALYRAICALGVFVHNDFLNQTAIESDAKAACKKNGLWADNGEDDINDTIANGWAHSENDKLPKLEDTPEFKAKQAKRGKKGGNDQGGGQEPPAAAAPSDPTDKPMIRIEPGTLHEMTMSAMQALVDLNVNIFQRGGKLVRPAPVKGIDSKGRSVHTSVLVEVDKVFLRKTLCENIDWFRKDGRVKKGDPWKKADAPKEIAEMIISMTGLWTFRTISGIISTPTLRFDGTILREQGYDPITHLYLESRVTLPPMPAVPTQADAEKALKLLKGLLAEFPFVNAASMSVALSAMLTAIGRGMIDVAPAHGARAPAAGTGKSYLFDIVSAILQGERCPVISVSSDSDGETEKRIIGMAMSGQQLIHLDNVNGTLGGDALCQLIERPTCNLRPLGRSETVQIQNRACVFFNGNNCRVKGDMTRRVVIAELDAKMEKPAEREFRADPVATVLADRPTYIAACMTILRAYQAAGSPKVIKVPMNSFGEWSGIMRSALVWLGCADPCETIQKARDEDPELQRIAAFVAAARPLIGSDKTAKTARDIANLGMKTESGFGMGDYRPVNPDLHNVISEFADRGSAINFRRFGNWLSDIGLKVVDGLRVAVKYDTCRKINTYFIEDMNAGGSYAAA
jgi:putative DNA primase/helicase